MVAELAEEDDLTRRVYDSFRQFREQAVRWHTISEQAYLEARNL